MRLTAGRSVILKLDFLTVPGASLPKAAKAPVGFVFSIWSLRKRMTSPAANAWPRAEIFRQLESSITLPTHMHQVHGDAAPLANFAVAHDDAGACSEPTRHLRIRVAQYPRQKHIPDGNGGNIVERRDVEMERGRREEGREEGGECPGCELADSSLRSVRLTLY